MARFVYVDEAGISSRREEPFLVVAGAIVHGDHQVDRLYDALEEILVKHVPEDKRNGLVLHAAEIYGGFGKVFDKERYPEWTWEKRAALLDDLARLPKALNLYVTSGMFKRSDDPEIPTTEAQVITYLACLIEVEAWFKQNAKRENCMVIAEDNRDARKRIKELHRFYQQKSLEQDPRFQGLLPLKRIREDPAFQEKRPSHPLILADFLAFATKRKLMDDKRIDRFCKPWWKRHASLKIVLPRGNQRASGNA